MAHSPTKPNHIYLIYMYKEDLAMNNLQWLILEREKMFVIIFGEEMYSCACVIPSLIVVNKKKKDEEVSRRSR